MNDISDKMREKFIGIMSIYSDVKVQFPTNWIASHDKNLLDYFTGSGAEYVNQWNGWDLLRTWLERNWPVKISRGRVRGDIKTAYFMENIPLGPGYIPAYGKWGFDEPLLGKPGKRFENKLKGYACHTSNRAKRQ
jgi:hypothetical protein